jgi:prephenate dehydrogenase
MVDRTETDPAQAVHGADLVVLATPVGSMPGLLRRVAAVLQAGVLVTDVGSVKRPLAEHLPGLLPSGAFYQGSHPMVGGHRAGAAAADPDLFVGAAVVVVSTGLTRAPQSERLRSFWRALGARVVRRDAEEHDREVAWISHVPHVLAFAFARALRGAPAGADELAGPGFRDFTRIARANPELWADILCANAKAVSHPLQRVAESFAELAAALEGGDETQVARLLGQAAEGLAPEPARNRTVNRASAQAAAPDGDRESE